MAGLRIRTVYKEAVGELIEKKSKFYSRVKPIRSEEEAQVFIEQIRKEHNNANHHVFAYVIGYNNEIQRYSDDGEPSGTAGLPILDLLKGEGIKNTVVVVTRYFGGTLLGTGGLVRAYAHCAKEGLLKSCVIEKVQAKKLKITVDYALAGKLQYYFNEEALYIQDTTYAQEVTYQVMVEMERYEQVIEVLNELTSGNLFIQDQGEVFIAHVEGQVLVYEQ